MALLALQDPGVRLAVRSRTVILMRGNRTIRSVRLHEVDEIHIYGLAGITPEARQILLARGIDVLFFTPRGQYRGRLVSSLSSNAQRRLRQYARLSEPAFALRLAQRFVLGKLVNQRTLLQRVRRERPSDELAGSVAALRHAVASVDRAEDLEALRGVEGHGTAMYFRGLARAITNPEFEFPRRTRRPPRDPVNACLSFGYTLLLTRVESAVRRTGLDPYLGALHSAGRGKPALPLDLMEELRPVVVDRLVLRLVNRRQLSPGDFEDPGVDLGRIAEPLDGDPGDGESSDDAPRPVYLGPTGRAIFLRELGRVWRRRLKVDALGGRYRLEDILNRQAALVARCLEDDEIDYEPFRMR